jgi:hypothetical protein
VLYPPFSSSFFSLKTPSFPLVSPFWIIVNLCEAM